MAREGPTAEELQRSKNGFEADAVRPRDAARQGGPSQQLMHVPRQARSLQRGSRPLPQGHHPGRAARRPDLSHAAARGALGGAEGHRELAAEVHAMKPRALLAMLLTLTLVSAPTMTSARHARSQPAPAGRTRPGRDAADRVSHARRTASRYGSSSATSCRWSTPCSRSGRIGGRSQPGIATMTAALLDEGTAKRSAREFVKARRHAGRQTVRVAPARSKTSITLETLTKHLDEALALMGEMVAQPAFHGRGAGARAQVAAPDAQAAEATADRRSPTRCSSVVVTARTIPTGVRASGTQESIRASPATTSSRSTTATTGPTTPR